MNKITPWIVPKSLISIFCETATCSAGSFFVKNILEHNNNNYLVITEGNYPFIEYQLESYLTIYKEALREE